MSFDLFTLAAQIVNFAILVLLLRIFLYAPVQRTMRERERRIAEEREAATKALERAREEADALEEEREAFRRQRRERERELEQELAERREARLEEIEEEARETRSALADALERDRDESLTALRRRGGELLAEELRRALSQLADASLERQAIAAFRRRLEELGDDARDELRRAASDEPVRIATAFAADAEARDELRAAVGELLGEEARVRFERDPELGFGASLQIGGVRVAWSAGGYAEALEEAFEDAVGELRGTPVELPEASGADPSGTADGEGDADAAAPAEGAGSGS